MGWISLPWRFGVAAGALSFVLSSSFRLPRVLEPLTSLIRMRAKLPVASWIIM